VTSTVANQKGVAQVKFKTFYRILWSWITSAGIGVLITDIAKHQDTAKALNRVPNFFLLFLRVNCLPKVKCEDCGFWLFKDKRRNHAYIVSFSFAYRAVGTCLSDKKGEDTLGYTGGTQGHKMTRVGETLRWCKRFKPKS
jgi:hypothetical protein